MRLSQVGWTTAIVSCMAFGSVKFQNFREYRTLLLVHCPCPYQILPHNSCIATASLATCRKANSIQDAASYFQGYSRSLSSHNCPTQIYLLSNNSTLLLPPTQKMLPTLGARSFAAAAAPALWNKLPADVRTVAS